MPAEFDRCVRRGGRVRTIKPKGKDDPTFVRVCYPRGGGSPISDHPKERKEK